MARGKQRLYALSSEITFRGWKVSVFHYRKLLIAGSFTKKLAKVKSDFRAE
jgi:hypothetical protein